jgi:hypothetical protein
VCYVTWARSLICKLRNLAQSLLEFLNEDYALTPLLLQEPRNVRNLGVVRWRHLKVFEYRCDFSYTGRWPKSTTVRHYQLIGILGKTVSRVLLVLVILKGKGSALQASQKRYKTWNEERSHCPHFSTFVGDILLLCWMKQLWIKKSILFPKGTRQWCLIN